MLSLPKCGLYSSRSRQKWKEWEHVTWHAPDGGKNVHLENDALEEKDDIIENETSATFPGKSTWARLIAKVYEVDPLVCTKCGGEMKVVAVIMDPVEVEKILRHLVKTGKSPPGVLKEDLGMVS